MNYVYIMTNSHRTVLYTGVTNDLCRRVYEHKNGVNHGFTYRYNAHLLVYYECVERIDDAISREKQIKKLSRANKTKLIEKKNPAWNDLSDFV